MKKGLSIKTVEIWSPTVKKLWFGLYRVTKWTHFVMIGGEMFVNGKGVNEFANSLVKKTVKKESCQIDVGVRGMLKGRKIVKDKS